MLYEDADVVVVSKPRGLPTHPLSREETDTLAQALLARYPEMEGVGYAQREPGILHRLDTDTSGVLVAARHAQAFDALKASQRAGTWDKRYLAFCEGAPRAPDRIVAALRPDPDDKRKMSVVYGSEEGDAERERITELLEVEPLGALKSADGARVQVSAVTLAVHNATRHQVRAHLAFYGHPLVGDELYGGAGLEGETGPTAHWLHASQVEFPFPSAKTPGERVVVRAPESELMQALRRRAAV